MFVLRSLSQVVVRSRSISFYMIFMQICLFSENFFVSCSCGICLIFQWISNWNKFVYGKIVEISKSTSKNLQRANINFIEKLLQHQNEWKWNPAWNVEWIWILINVKGEEINECPDAAREWGDCWWGKHSCLGHELLTSPRDIRWSRLAWRRRWCEFNSFSKNIKFPIIFDEQSFASRTFCSGLVWFIK